MNLEQVLANVSFTTNRLFGIEIEVNGISPFVAADALVRAGIQTREESYNHARRTWWKVTTDGSLSGGANSCEVVSPPLPYNIESLKLVGIVIRTLRAAGATVDTTCGIHVHVDCRDLTTQMADFSRVIFLRYRECEDVIDQMVDQNRRNNRFCLTLKGLSRSSHFASLRYNRYQKLNFCSFERHGTIEFRQHEGSLNDAKVVSWIVFCLSFFEKTREYFLEHGTSQIQNPAQWA